MASLAPPRTSVALATAAIAATSLVLGAVAGRSPMLAAGAAGGILVLALTFAAPVALLTLLMLTAAIVPYDVQNRFGVSAGGSAGIVFTDVVVLCGLLWAMIAIVNLARTRLSGRIIATLALTIAFLAVAAFQVVHGVRGGADAGAAGYEFRHLLGLAVFVIAFPMLFDPVLRPQLMKALLVFGLILGLWGLAQWILQIPANATEDIGIRQGVSHTTSGTGQLLGGRYAYPPAVILAFAALISGWRRTQAMTTLLLVILGLNAISLILTFERAFWVSAALGVLLVLVRAGHLQRLRAAVWGGLALLLISGAFSVVAPGEATAVRERFISIGQYHSDESVDYRLIESRAVIARIDASPWSGSGLGSTIYWGRPSSGVPAKHETYSHNAYLRTAWKLGIPGLVLLMLLMATALVGRRGKGEYAVLATGARAALLALLIMGVTGPVFDTINSSSVIGLLIALATVLPALPDPAPEPGAA